MIRAADRSQPYADRDSRGETGLCKGYKRRNYKTFSRSPYGDSARLLLILLDLAQKIVLQFHGLDQLMLRFQPVDMLLFGDQDFVK